MKKQEEAADEIVVIRTVIRICFLVFTAKLLARYLAFAAKNLKRQGSMQEYLLPFLSEGFF